MAKDYYKILNVEKNASADEVKRAFRKLAHQYHPDKASGDEAKFKEINEAYQVIGDEEKRRQYDQFGATFDQQGGFGGGMNWDDFMRYARQGGGGGATNFNFGNVDLGDVFGDLFGFGGGRSRRQSQGRDIQTDVPVLFEEAAFGVKKNISLFKQVTCKVCHGNAAEPGTPITTCSRCQGSGVITSVQQTMLGAFQSRAACPDCHGEGKIAKTPCRECSGQGVTKEKVEISVDIPAGIDDGQTICLRGQGEAGARGSAAGDLYVTIRIKNNNDFERDGADVYSQISVSMSQAILGDKIEIKTIDGHGKLTVPAGTQSGTLFKLRGQGVPYLQRSGRGDHYVKVVVTIPKKLSFQQKKVIKELRESGL